MLASREHCAFTLAVLDRIHVLELTVAHYHLLYSPSRVCSTQLDRVHFGTEVGRLDFDFALRYNEMLGALKSIFTALMGGASASPVELKAASELVESLLAPGAHKVVVFSKSYVPLPVSYRSDPMQLLPVLYSCTITLEATRPNSRYDESPRIGSNEHRGSYSGLPCSAGWSGTSDCSSDLCQLYFGWGLLAVGGATAAGEAGGLAQVIREALH